jgi:hypothetical protein
MTDNLNKIMEKLKKSQKTTDIAKVKEENIEKKEEVDEVEDIEEDDDEDDMEEETKEEEPKKEVEEKPIIKKTSITPKKIEIEEKPKKKEPSDEELLEQRAKEIEFLQNNGIFRIELLHRLSQINDNLFVLNSLIHNVIGGEDDKQKKNI